jgi:CheY-like chemotaxis protein/DNA-directed RNA polymerase specialized sigma24 family protein
VHKPPFYIITYVIGVSVIYIYWYFETTVQENQMSISKYVSRDLPYLRRYARAVTGSQLSGDSLVRTALEAVIANPALIDDAAHAKIGLYKVAHADMNGFATQDPENAQRAKRIEKNVQAHLSLVTPDSRLALLLTTLEEFSAADAAEIMSTTPDEVERLASDAIAEIAAATKTHVLIIEDEPLITLQLEALVNDIGHRVCGTPTTLDEALDSVSRHRPGLILADIQLADGSSGVDAIKQILEKIDVPVIFITAFPERLLTGERSEPTYLITKPFLESTVKAAIGQAMFLGSTTLPLSV